MEFGKQSLTQLYQSIYEKVGLSNTLDTHDQEKFIYVLKNDKLIINNTLTKLKTYLHNNLSNVHDDALRNALTNAYALLGASFGLVQSFKGSNTSIQINSLHVKQYKFALMFLRIMIECIDFIVKGLVVSLRYTSKEEYNNFAKSTLDEIMFYLKNIDTWKKYVLNPLEYNSQGTSPDISLPEPSALNTTNPGFTDPDTPGRKNPLLDDAQSILETPTPGVKNPYHSQTSSFTQQSVPLKFDELNKQWQDYLQSMRQDEETKWINLQDNLNALNNNIDQQISELRRYLSEMYNSQRKRWADEIKHHNAEKEILLNRWKILIENLNSRGNLDEMLAHAASLFNTQGTTNASDLSNMEKETIAKIFEIMFNAPVNKKSNVTSLFGEFVNHFEQKLKLKQNALSATYDKQTSGIDALLSYLQKILELKGSEYAEDSGFVNKVANFVDGIIQKEADNESDEIEDDIVERTVELFQKEKNIDHKDRSSLFDHIVKLKNQNNLHKTGVQELRTKTRDEQKKQLIQFLGKLFQEGTVNKDYEYFLETLLSIMKKIGENKNNEHQLETHTQETILKENEATLDTLRDESDLNALFKHLDGLVSDEATQPLENADTTVQEIINTLGKVLQSMPSENVVGLSPKLESFIKMYFDQLKLDADHLRLKQKKTLQCYRKPFHVLNSSIDYPSNNNQQRLIDHITKLIDMRKNALNRNDNERRKWIKDRQDGSSSFRRLLQTLNNNSSGSDNGAFQKLLQDFEKYNKEWQQAIQQDQGVIEADVSTDSDEVYSDLEQTNIPQAQLRDLLLKLRGESSPVHSNIELDTNQTNTNESPIDPKLLETIDESVRKVFDDKIRDLAKLMMKTKQLPKSDETSVFTKKLIDTYALIEKKINETIAKQSIQKKDGASEVIRDQELDDILRKLDSNISDEQSQSDAVKSLSDLIGQRVADLQTHYETLISDVRRQLDDNVKKLQGTLSTNSGSNIPTNMNTSTTAPVAISPEDQKNIVEKTLNTLSDSEKINKEISNVLKKRFSTPPFASDFEKEIRSMLSGGDEDEDNVQLPSEKKQEIEEAIFDSLVYEALHTYILNILSSQKFEEGDEINKYVDNLIKSILGDDPPENIAIVTDFINFLSRIQTEKTNEQKLFLKVDGKIFFFTLIDTLHKFSHMLKKLPSFINEVTNIAHQNALNQIGLIQEADQQISSNLSDLLLDILNENEIMNVKDIDSLIDDIKNKRTINIDKLLKTNKPTLTLLKTEMVTNIDEILKNVLLKNTGWDPQLLDNILPTLRDEHQRVIEDSLSNSRLWAEIKKKILNNIANQNVDLLQKYIDNSSQKLPERQIIEWDAILDHFNNVPLQIKKDIDSFQKVINGSRELIEKELLKNTNIIKDIQKRLNALDSETLGDTRRQLLKQKLDFEDKQSILRVGFMRIKDILDEVEDYLNRLSASRQA